MENFLYSLNATLPIFLIMVLGKVLFRLKIINEEFTKSADKYVFYVALPALVFKDLTENNIRESFDLKYVLYCFFVTLFVILILWFLNEKFMKREPLFKLLTEAAPQYSVLPLLIICMTVPVWRH